MLGKIFWYVRQNFRIFVEKYLVWPEIFFGMSVKKCWWPPSPSRSPTILGRNINVQFTCSGKLYCAPPNKIRPIRPWTRSFSTASLLLSPYMNEHLLKLVSSRLMWNYRRAIVRPSVRFALLNWFCNTFFHLNKVHYYYYRYYMAERPKPVLRDSQA
jgi:hypothetical protein